MKNIAIFTPRIYYHQLAKAAQDLGYSTIDFSYHLIDNSSLLRRILTSSIPNYAYKKQSECFNNQLTKFLDNYKSLNVDLVLFLKGQYIYDEVMNKLKNINATKVFWSIDSLVRLPQVNCNKISDLNFYQDEGDCKYSNDFWLPLGIDTTFFYDVKLKKYDITFIGRMKGKSYNRRYKYFIELINSDLGDQFNVNVISNLNIHKQIKNRLRLKRINYLHKLSYEKFSKMVCESKLVINIHQDDGLRPINPLFFSIPYCKALQIVDDRPYFNKWLPDTFYQRSKLNEFIYTIRFMLENYDKFIMWLNSENNILDKHTMTSRLRDILNKVSV